MVRVALAWLLIIYFVGQSLSAQSVHVYKGIPYAKPPLGDYRWRPPHPIGNFLPEKILYEFSPACMQPEDSFTQGFFYRKEAKVSEDCLYLNIWSPNELVSENSLKTSKPLPVLVWIHGGGFLTGSTSNDFYDGEGLAKKGVIFVSLNYRLGIFGYFSHPELSAESPFRSSGNYGTLDQIQALKWLQQNIALFGGDPNNVTIMGESAGGTSVVQLLSTPLSKSLFHKAIVQSSVLFPNTGLSKGRLDLPSAEQRGEYLADKLEAKSLTALRKIPAHALADFSSEFYAQKAPDIVVDGWVFKQSLIDTFNEGKQHNVPVLVGYTADETSFYRQYGLVPKRPHNQKSYRKKIKEKYGVLANEYLAIYPPNDLEAAVFSPLRDGIFGWAAQRLARKTASAGSKAYLYYFNHAPQWARENGMGAFHAVDLFYSFNNVTRNVKYSDNWPDLSASPEDILMAETVSDYWVSFAKTGEPVVLGAPVWPAFKEGEPYFMEFSNGKAILGKDLSPGMYALHEKIVNQRIKNRKSWWVNSVGLHASALDAAEVSADSKR